MITKTILPRLMIVLAVGTASLAAHAEKSREDRFSAQKWSEDFAQSLKSKNKEASKSLLNFTALDKKYLSQCSDCDSKAKMAEARKVFAKGQYDQARALYNQVGKGSDYWLQAVEEKGWTYFRQDKFEDALAQTKTLLSPQFASYVDSEAYFLQSLTQLKICDYKSVFESNKLFKEKQKARLAEIQNLASSGMNEALVKVIKDVDTFPMAFNEVSENANHLPSMFYKDLELQRQILRYKLSEKALEVLKAQGLAEGFGLAETVDKLRVQSAASIRTRMKTLAQDETNSNFAIVQKLNLVEVESIQRLHTDVEMDKALFKKTDFNKTTSDQLVFVDDGRPWIDELDKYEVRAKSCPQNLRRKM